MYRVIHPAADATTYTHNTAMNVLHALMLQTREDGYIMRVS